MPSKVKSSLRNASRFSPCVDAEDLQFGRDRAPEPGELVGLAPTRLVAVDEVSALYGVEGVVVRSAQRLARAPLHRRDGAQRDAGFGSEERDGDVAGLAAAQPAASREQGHDRLESHAGASGGNALGQVRGGDLAAPSTSNAVQHVLDDLGGDRRDLHDLVPDRIIDGVLAVQCRVTDAASIRMKLHAAIDLLGCERLARLALVPGLAARLAARRLLLAPLLPRLVRRRWLGGVGGILIEAGGQLTHLLLENGVVLTQAVILADQVGAVRLEVADTLGEFRDLLLERRPAFRHTLWIGHGCEGAERLRPAVSVHPPGLLYRLVVPTQTPTSVPESSMFTTESTSSRGKSGARWGGTHMCGERETFSDGMSVARSSGTHE